MISLSGKNLIVVGSILTVVIGYCGYNIINSRLTGQVTFQRENTSQNLSVAGTNEVRSGVGVEPADKPKEIVIHVIGRVKKPGLVKIAEGGRIAEAIEAAGGAEEDADLDIINLAYKLQDGKQVYIPSKNEQLNQSLDYSKNRTASSSNNKNLLPQAKKPVPGVQAEVEPPRKIVSDSSGVVEEKGSQVNEDTDIININTADIKELDKLPGIGPSTAQKIIEYREKNGAFKTIEDIMKVKGIGNSKYDKIKEKITV